MTARWTEFKSILGEGGVTVTEAALQAAERATYATNSRVLAILHPKTRKEVQECVRAANRLGTALYPVSGGKNWGYGSRVPTADACLLDLSGLRRIADYHPKLGYITVEAGVTQRQLHEFLLQQNAPFWMDSTGASPESSIVGNTVERGFGHTPYADHFAHSCAMEVVLPTGECIETGFARYSGARPAPVYKWGVGPILDGLFSQSNFGIVTKMTIWLMPKPEHFEAFFFRCDKDDDLAPLIDVLQPLRLQGLLPSASHIVNDYKVLSGLRQYPWDRAGGVTPLPRRVMDEMRREMNFGVWNGSAALYGTRGQVKEAKAAVKRALRGRVSRLAFLDDKLLRWVSRFAKPMKMVSGWDLSEVLELVNPIYNLMKGIPTDQPLRSAYWRKRYPPPSHMDPDRDGCGLIWCAPIAPLTGADASSIASIADRVVTERGFEPALSFTLTSGRALTGVISLGYDRDLPGEDHKAADCYKDLTSALTDAGYRFYRLGVNAMNQSYSGEDYQGVLSRIRDALDPAHIIAPGRYL